MPKQAESDMRKTIDNQADYGDRDAQTSLMIIKRIFESPIFNPIDDRSPYFQACITQVLIELNDVLQKAAKKNLRITFTDDIPQSAKAKDITDLINDCRNASCHVASGKRMFENSKFTFCVISGYSPQAMLVNGTALGCNYHDDIAIFWGNTRLYLVRHLFRAFHEANAVFSDL
jgi:hypothetical protein